MPEAMMPQVVKALSIGTELAFSIIIGAFVGYIIGGALGYKWVFLTLGIILGLIGGLYRLYKTYK